MVRDWIEQLAEQECIERTGEYGVLRLTEKGRRVLKGMEQPLLLEAPKKKAAPKPSVDRDSWEGVDRQLFERLRLLRRELARQRSVPAYIVFTDATLRDLARKRPLTTDDLLRVSGIGMKKLEQYGEELLSEIREYCS